MVLIACLSGSGNSFLSDSTNEGGAPSIVERVYPHLFGVLPLYHLLCDSAGHAADELEGCRLPIHPGHAPRGLPHSDGFVIDHDIGFAGEIAVKVMETDLCTAGLQIVDQASNPVRLEVLHESFPECRIHLAVKSFPAVQGLSKCLPA